ncbi:xylosidase/arabinosidase [Gaeumannomyces tritici R3-111a-1]|uniref:Xylosidase/arabinosidase n=1 Tax=Gaeumannomyces tritici (strain R3-111a-1) TaxID=644352 RepID=J3P701_GAET3|nr:xylosidase/arabinosidase [Gaeumannomyces tritici R3-111a-1]EJT72432.1 xylosidase/arabinosidase [Gaeumannomyces tritici R3-111a-1]
MDLSKTGNMRWGMKTACRGLLIAALAGAPSLVKADNPIVQTRFTADPAPMVYKDRLYALTSHDNDGATYFNMTDWRLYSTDDMANWQDHGSPAGLATFPWASKDAWAPQAIERNGKFYLYVPIQPRAGGGAAIGVGVADKIEGPYKDAIGRPLVQNGEIDPTVFLDDDGQAYLFWGNPNLSYVKLNADMISYSGQPVRVQLTVQGFGQRAAGKGDARRPTAYEEGPWLYKRNGVYYMLYAANCCSEDIRYATAPAVTGPWTYRGLIMATEGASFTNHPAVVHYKNNAYFFYHNGALPGGGGYARSVSVERFSYGSDGSIPTMRMSKTGAPQIKDLDPYVRVEAETIAFSRGVGTEPCSEGGINVNNINNGDYVKVAGVAFGDSPGPKTFTTRVAAGGSAQGAKIELRLGGESGTLVGSCNVPASTGGWQSWTTVSCGVSGATGTKDLFFKFVGSGSGYLFNMNWWQFSK